MNVCMLVFNNNNRTYQCSLPYDDDSDEKTAPSW